MTALAPTYRLEREYYQTSSTKYETRYDYYIDFLIVSLNKTGYKWKDTVKAKYFTASTNGNGYLSDVRSDALRKAKALTKYNIFFQAEGSKLSIVNGLNFVTFDSGSNSSDYYYCSLFYLESTDNIEPIEYTLSFDYGQGSGSVTTIQVKYDEVIYQRLPSGMRDMYNLSGWKIAGTSIGSGTKYTWANDMTASAQWTFSGLTLNSSVSSAGGGAIVGAKTQYASGELLSVQAVPNSGYKFDSWTYNGSTITANPLMVNITANSTLVANFKQTVRFQLALLVLAHIRLKRWATLQIFWLPLQAG